MNKYNENFKLENGILHFHLSGKFPDELLSQQENLFEPLIDACSEMKCTKALIDARELQADFNTFDMFKAGKDTSTLIRYGLRIALLARKEMISDFFENVTVNCGGNIGVFTEMNDALKWLQHKLE